MTEAGRLPRKDIQRISRVVTEYEAGNLTAKPRTDDDKQTVEGPVRFVLLEPYTVHEDAGEDPEASYGCCFSARAAQLAPSRQRVQILRQAPGRPEDQPFRLEFHGGTRTELLRCNMTTEEILAELETLKDLKDEVEIIGKDSLFGPADDEIEFAGNQWHIRFSDEFNDGDLLRISEGPENARLFVDFFWPTNTVRRIFPAFPTSPTDLSPGAIITAQSVPGFGWMQFGGECYRV